MSFVKVKLGSLIYPYLIWSFLQLFSQVLMSSYINGNVVSSELICFFLPRAQFWFLLSLFIISVLTVFFIGRFLLPWLILSSAASFVYYILQPELGFIDKVIRHLMFFNFGIFLSNYKTELFSVLNSRFVLVINLLFFCGLIFYAFWVGQMFSIIEFGFAMSGFMLVIQIAVLFSSDRFSVLKDIGRQSMSIYILHILVGSGFRVFLDKVLDCQNIVIHLLFGTLIGVGIPYLICRSGLIARASFLFRFPRTLS